MANFNVVVDGVQYSDTDLRVMRERIAELEYERDTYSHNLDKMLAENERLREHIGFIQSDDFMPHYYALEKDAERYRKWKREGMSYSNGFYHLDLYGGTEDMEWTNPDAVADHTAMEGE